MSAGPASPTESVGSAAVVSQSSVPARVGRRRWVFAGLAVSAAVILAATLGITLTREHSADQGSRDFESNSVELPFVGLQSPWGIAVDDHGSVYVADRGSGDQGHVMKLAPGANESTELPFGTLTFPTAVAVDKAGSVYVTSTNPARVLKLAANSAAPSVLPLLGIEEGASALAVDAEGNVYTFSDSHQAMKYPPDAVDGTVLPFGLLNDPTGTAVDAVGNVYVTDNGNRLLKLPEGAGSAIRLAEVDYPASVAVDPAGDVYVLASFNGILKFAPGASSPVGIRRVGPAAKIAVGVKGDVYATDEYRKKVRRLPM